MKTDKLEIDVAGAKMPAYLAAPDGEGKKPAVVVFEEIFGVNSHVRAVTERVAREGYVAIAPDYHHRVAAGRELEYTPEGMAKGMEVIPALTEEGFRADVEATLRTLSARDDVDMARLGAIGFCIGGHATYLAAAMFPFRAAASFYGGGVATGGFGKGAYTLAQTPGIVGRIVCFFGGQDPMISGENVAAIKKALAEAGTDHEVVVYDHATHGFFCDQRGSYDAKSSADAWDRVKQLFATL